MLCAWFPVSASRWLKAYFGGVGYCPSEGGAAPGAAPWIDLILCVGWSCQCCCAGDWWHSVLHTASGHGSGLRLTILPEVARGRIRDLGTRQGKRRCEQLARGRQAFPWPTRTKRVVTTPGFQTVSPLDTIYHQRPLTGPGRGERVTRRKPDRGPGQRE